MITEISALPGFEEAGLYTEKSEQVLGRDDFLKMFLAQLNHQDPLNPMDSSQFSSQLAQFSSLEQLFNVNNNLESIKSVQDTESSFQALNLMGKIIEAEGNVLNLEPGQISTGGFTLEENADCSVLISDADGLPVRELHLGVLGIGEHSFQWDGRDNKGNDMPAGIYGFEMAAVNQSGDLLSVETRIRGRITRVSLDGAESLVYVGEMPVDISQIMDVSLPDTGTDE
ncbi:MAG: flagellar hook assembly protein FlgD [Deltaproteobacteria bacterium]|nr:flagellar hook assembly protein FlgD [Deltaproteobacteria bacterium]